MKAVMKTVILTAVLCCALIAPAGVQTQRLQAGDPPDPAAITVSEPNSRGIVTLTGAQNAVSPGAYLTVRNLYTGEVIATQAGMTGTFEVAMRGVHGNPFAISPSQTAIDQREFPGTLPGGPMTIVYSPRLSNSERAEVIGALGSGFWVALLEADSLIIDSGDTWTLSYRLEVEPGLLADFPNAVICIEVMLDLIAEQNRPNGRLLAVEADGANNGWSRSITPLTMGIIGETQPAAGAENCAPLSGVFTDVLTPALINDLQITIPETLNQSALLVPRIAVDVRSESGSAVLAESGSRLPFVLAVNGAENRITELPAALLWDHPSDGSRGLLPSNSPFALVNRVRENSRTYILPPGEYPVEPYLLNMLPNLFDGYAAPLIPFDFPNGRLRVEITTPDFQRDEFTTVFTQNQMGRGSDDETLFGRQSPIDTFRLGTNEPLLSAYPFDQYGEYRIRAEIQITDIFGNAYTGGGDYRVWIAEPIDMTLGILPGMPIPGDQPIYMGGQVSPAIPAEVTARVRYLPLGGIAPIVTTLDMTANRFGVFSYIEGEQVFEEPGEYLIDYDARYVDGDGRLWMGSARLAGVVVLPDSALIAHGERGILGENTDPPPAWFAAREYAEIVGADPDNIIINMPFHNGDIAHIGADGGDGFAPRLWLQDTNGAYTAHVLQNDLQNGASLVANSPVWGLPLTAGSYGYLAAVTPGVTVRQYILTGSPDLPLFADSNDPLNGQLGAGFGGLYIGDVVFFFGGAVVRDQDMMLAETAGYASSAVVISNRLADPLRDPQGIRVYPPGRDEIILSIGNVDHAMFVIPMGTNAGNVLELGETLAVAGQIAPMLPATVQVTITAPDGTQSSFETQATPFGYFYDPSQDVTVDQVGVWTVQVNAIFEGQVSAGIREIPIAGGPLGAANGSYDVYVTAPGSEMIPWNPLLRDTTIPAALAYNFNFTAPPEWTDIAAYRTLTMPGYILQDGEMRLSGRSIAPQYNPQEISRLFPNVEVEGRFSGAAGSDPKTLTIVFTGADENGEPQLTARVFTIFHDRLITLAE